MAPDMRGEIVQMCKINWVEHHICYDTFYEMYEFLCECLKAVLNPSEYHDINEEVALTGSWDQETRTNMEIDLETPQIRCANIITMENATCSGACCLIILYLLMNNIY